MTTADTDRHLRWEGCFNVRDLGGIAGIRRGALVRADGLGKLTARGWRALVDHGVRTVVDLRNPDEYGEDAAPRPAAVTTVRIPLDGIEHRDFWDRWWGGWEFGTPVYYRPFLARFPERVAAVVTAIAGAPPGGVVHHCSAGRDRTGLVSLVLLSLMGADPVRIADDYVLSEPRVKAMNEAGGRPDDGPELAAGLASRGLTAHRAAVDVARWLRAGPYLSAAGVPASLLGALTDRAGGAAPEPG
ncbi:tyrosine-protein phosphatase [Streptomyces sp. GC420]|uniref:tyrosine-protein phosphatase n=1 Tax=Streptomyces sp. GC420 TaxID=2697568 RepID=UPI001414F56C|nr:tyrosine-protein phosphatase [Streptomyces sp. GC420]NBM20756.1 protein-tyrosine-phosphatase [Streptomyces sp. GC420]